MPQLSLLLALAVAMLFGAMLGQDVAATKNTGKKPTSIAKRVQAQAGVCEANGGTISIRKTAFGSTITHCTGGDQDGYTCVNTKKASYCTYDLTQLPSSPVTDPAAPPTNGNEQPGGGPQPGGGAGVDPGAGNEQPGGSDGGVVATSYHGGHHHHGHDKGRTR
jgi:hypothetical protein